MDHIPGAAATPPPPQPTTPPLPSAQPDPPPQITPHPPTPQLTLFHGTFRPLARALPFPVAFVAVSSRSACSFFKLLLS